MRTIRLHLVDSRRDQRGFSLVEMMVAVALGALLAVPVLTWMFTAVKARDTSVRSSERANVEGLLRRYLVPDISGSGAGATTATDCVGGISGGGTVVLELTSGSSGPSRVLYSVLTNAKGESALWRRACDGPGLLAAETRIANRLRRPPSGWHDLVDCRDRPGLTADTCGQVEVAFGVSGSPAFAVTASRRSGPPR